VQNNAGIGSDAATIVRYIQMVREAVKGTLLEGTPVGHVDTWTEWVEGRNGAVVAAVDWVGMDAYGYW
jgi:glucan endo-1,3-beta-D-glucosidase